MKAPPPVAYCGVDLCKQDDDFCTKVEEDEVEKAESPYAKERRSAISRRGDEKDFLAGWPGRPGARYRAFAYLSLAEMFAAQAPRFLRTLYRVVVGPCRDPSVDEEVIPLTRTLQDHDLDNFEAEHIIDVSENQRSKLLRV